MDPPPLKCNYCCKNVSDYSVIIGCTTVTVMNVIFNKKKIFKASFSLVFTAGR